MPIAARFSVVEAVRDGWRVSAKLVPVNGGPAFSKGPVHSAFNSSTPPGTERSVSFSIPVPPDAAPGTYRVQIDHYDRVEGKWLHVRYVDTEGRPQSTILAQLELIPRLPGLPVPPPQRRLRPGEIHRVFECEDFQGMAGRGEDLGVARGWTWYSHRAYSRLRAAVNTTGSGVIHTAIDPALPSGGYKLFVKAGSTFSTLRVSLGNASIEVDPIRTGWHEAGTVRPTQAAGELSLEVLEKIGPYAIVDSIYVTNDLAAEATCGIDPSRQFLPPDAKPTKQQRTVWTDGYLQGVRQRIQSHPSVREAADKAIAEGQRIAAHSDEALWELLADTSIRRTYYVNQNKGCPVCGLKIKEHGVFHPWILDPFTRPYKMTCPSCNGVFPSNDFAAREMTGGDYPDDGTGCTIGADTFHFIGEYTHWLYRTYFFPYVRALTHATVLSDDPELAHKLGVMLLRAAQQWPNSEDRCQRSFTGKNGLGSGCVTDRIWSSSAGKLYGWAYDAVWPFLDRDEPLLSLARERLPDVNTHEDLRLYLEENLLRRIGQAYCDTAIQGNAGYHHKGVAGLLLALDDMDSERFPNSCDLLEFLYYRVFGAMRYLPNLIGRDGCSYESTGYNASRLNIVETMATLDRFFAEQRAGLDSRRYPSLWDDPRFRAQFDYYTDYLILDRWLASVGDATGGPIAPKHEPRAKLSVVSTQIAATAWSKYRSSKLARLAYGLDDQPPPPSLWEDVPLEELAEARRRAPDHLPRQTGILDEYGLAFLRSGHGEDERVLWLWYGQLLSHAHHDKLLYGLAGKGLDLMPDLGYPKSWEHTGRWEAHSLTHNTITVDGAGFPNGKARGRLTFLGTCPVAPHSDVSRRSQPRPGTKADAEAAGVSPPLLQVVEAEYGDMTGSGEVARRLLALIDIDDSAFYVVDVFDVRAGSSHTLSYHGPQANVTVEGVSLTPQDGGTAAGPDVEYGQPRTGPQGNNVHTPLAHMTDVARATPAGPFTIDYAFADEPDTHVRLTCIPPAATELVLATGRPPSQPDAYALRYCLQTRAGEHPLASRFVTVVEPYTKQRAVSSVEPLVNAGFGRPLSLRVRHAEGTDTLIFGPGRPTNPSADGAQLGVRAALVRTTEAGTTAVCAYGLASLPAPGTNVHAPSPALEGEILSCNYGRHSILVSGIPADERLVGQPVRVHNDLRSTMHLIAAVSACETGTELTLGTSGLRHEGWVAGVAERSIRDGAPSPWAFDTFLRGTRLLNEAGDRQWVVTGAAGGWHSAPTGTRLSLRSGPWGEASAYALSAALTDADGDGVAGFRIYEYGPGDRVSIPTCVSLTRSPTGVLSGQLSPTVQTTPPTVAGP